MGISNGEIETDLAERGYSRRQITKISAWMGAGIALASSGVPLWAQQNKPASSPLSGKVRIGSNECWVGPFEPARKAAAEIISHANFYHPSDELENLTKTIAQVEGVPADYVLAWPGSSDPLSRIVLAFCSPTRGLVTADVSYEQPWDVANWAGAKITKTPLTPDYRHDVRAMLAADPNAGLYYICSPNNPTGTLTPLADIEWLLANKPAGAVIMVDEAYLHFSHGKSAAYLTTQGKDVIVLRTFSKLFGMAGLRLGATIARPDLSEKLMRYDGHRMSKNLPLTAIVCGAESLKQPAMIAARRAEMITARDATFAHLQKRGIKYIPSDANMFMVDWGQPAAGVKDKFDQAGILIGRSWAPWPNFSRITVGSADDMKKFCATVDTIMA